MDQAQPRGTALARAEVDPARRAAAIADLAQSLAAQGSDTPLLEREVVRQVSELVGDAAALWRRDGDGHISLVAFSHWEPGRRAYIEQHAKHATHDDRVGVLPHVWASGEPLLLDADAVRQWMHVMQPAYQDYAREHGMVSLLVLPLKVRGVVVALLGVSRDSEPGHDEGDVVFVQQMGSVVAVALEHDRLLHQVRQQGLEERRAQRAAHRAALHDALTGLPNRRMLTERLHAGSGRDGQDVVLALLDVDDFKSLNDAYGHDAGDAALIQIAARRSAAHDHPAPGSRRTLARLGGDEFAVLLTAPGSAEQIAALMAALHASLHAPLRVSGRDVRTSISIGLARGRAADGAALLRYADIALYRAKRERLGWAEWAPEDDLAAEARLEQLAELDRALETGELTVHYQPIMSRAPLVDRSETRLVEALVRWQHPRRGLLRPAEFLTLAQQADRMGELTSTVLERVRSDLSSWAACGHAVQVSVNVGADVLGGAEFVTGLLADLDRDHLPPSALCLELTESEALTADGPALLHGLRDRGLGVALDDFGTGYANLAYLCELPLTRLKLDRSFVRRLSSDARTSTFVTGLIELVHRLGLPVVAEGVEDAAAAALLDELQVAYQQGFLHAYPQPAEQLTRAWACR